MQLDHIELSKLVVSPANMRAKHKDRDVAELIPSIRARGVLVPLLVRPNGVPDMYEIVAGRRRYFAAKTVAETDGTVIALPCAIMEPGDDAAALEASLIENIARLEADEVTQWETFTRLVKEGRSVESIAATFGLNERVVGRVLALGNLLPRIRNLYRTQQIDAATVRHLTMATIAQQRAWLVLYDSSDEYAPTGRVLREWLFGGVAIATTSALFDLSDYTAPIVGDLFEDHSYFSDSALFWTLQTKALEVKQQAYLADGWSDVVVIESGARFDRWEYENRSKSKGGRVYIVAHSSGAVEVHEGYLSRKEAQRIERGDHQEPATLRPELSSPLRRYIDLHRHAVVRARLLEHPWVALRLLLAHAIAGSPLWSVRTEGQRSDKAETENSVAACLAQAQFNDKRRVLLVRLGLEADTNVLVGGRHGALMMIFERLLGLSDEEGLQVVSIVMGETLEAGGEAIEPLGVQLEVDVGAVWQADEAFLVLLRDRKILLALVAEVAGAEAAQANADASGKVLKTILRDCIAGDNGRTKVGGWTPRWLRFPASTYLGAETPADERNAARVSENI